MSNNNTSNKNEEDSSTVASIVTKTFSVDISNSGSDNLAKLDQEISNFISHHHRHPDTEFQLTSALAGNLYVVTVVIRSPQAKETPDQKAAGLA
jgi:hypothetical protein